MTIRKTLNIIAGVVCMVFASLAFAAPASAAECKGLAKGTCEARNDCSHVKAHTRSDGSKVKAFCRKKAGKAANSKKKVKKKTASKKADEKAKNARKKAANKDKKAADKVRVQFALDNKHIHLEQPLINILVKHGGERKYGADPRGHFGREARKLLDQMK